MGISVVGAQPESGSNDFALNVGSSGNTTFVLDKTYPSGRYGVAFDNSDSTYDIYAVTAAGVYVGYTDSAILETTQDFRTLVVLGAANNEKILFTYKGPVRTPATKGDVLAAGPFLTAVVTSSLPDIDDTTVVNGGNFAEDVEISFIGQDTNETNAKNVVRSTSTQLVVTRPDSFTPDQSPYTVKAVNPGIPSPTGSSPHILSNAVTAGTNPVWVTGTDIFYNVGGATNTTLLATDTEASDIDYALVSGTLPSGLTLDGETGVISGTFSGSASEGDVTAITVRATDAGGNFLDKAFNLTANTAPTWTTAAGELDPAPSSNEAYSFQLVASTGTAGGALTYTLVSGALLTGHTLSSTGLISGTTTEVGGTVANFTVRVTDEGGLFVDRSFSATVVSVINFVSILLNNTSSASIANGVTVDAEKIISSHTYKADGSEESAYVATQNAKTGALLEQAYFTRTSGDIRVFGGQAGASQNPVVPGFWVAMQDESTGNSDPVVVQLNDDLSIAYQVGVSGSGNLKTRGIYVDGYTTAVSFYDEPNGRSGFAAFDRDTGSTSDTWYISNNNGPRGRGAILGGGYYATNIYGPNGQAFDSALIVHNRSGGIYFARYAGNSGYSDSFGVAGNSSVVFWGIVFNNTNVIYSFDTQTGNFRAAKTISWVNNQTAGFVTDASNNLYVLQGAGNTETHLIKFDQDLNVVWQRKIQLLDGATNAYYGADGQALAFDNNLDKVIINGRVFPPSGTAVNSPFTVAYPADGSFTGSVSISGGTFSVVAGQATIGTQTDNTFSFSPSTTGSYSTATKDIIKQTANFTQAIQELA